MNTATLAPTATRFQFTLPARLLAMLRRAVAPAASGVQGLDKGTTAWVARPLGHTVTCEVGTLWLAFDHEPVDVILEAGQSHRCVKASRLSIHALTAARMSVA